MCRDPDRGASTEPPGSVVDLDVDDAEFELDIRGIHYEAHWNASLMDHDKPEPIASDGFPVGAPLPYLQELDPRHWKYTGTPVVATLTREWTDGSVDTLIVLGPETAYVRRDNGRKRLVKQERGGSVAMARLVQHLPAPGSLDAPTAEIADPIEPMR